MTTIQRLGSNQRGMIFTIAILSLLNFASCTKKSEKDPIVAEFNGKKVRASEAFKEVKSRIGDMEEELFRIKENAINDYVEEELLKAEAKKQNLPIQALIDKEMGSETSEVTDDEINKFLGEKGLSLEDPRIRKSDVKDYLLFRKRYEKRQKYVAKLKKSSNVKILITAPESEPVKVATAGYPAWGNASAPVTIVEFSDFQCPYCQRAAKTVDEIKKAYGPDKVRIVFRDMPLPSHPRARPAALAALCANDEGKFWEFHDLLFENQKSLGDDDFKKYAKKLGLDESKFNNCLTSKKHESLVNASLREAEAIGIQATPSFVINGKILRGAQPFERFKERIDKALKG